MAIRHELAQFCREMTFEALPKEIVEHTKVCLMDHICLMLAGPRTYSEDFPDIGKFMRDLAGGEESSLVGLRGKLPCLNATLVNTAIGVSTSFDAIHKSTIIHLPAVLFPAMIAVAERQKASGKELITATVVGTEIMTRFGMAMGPRNIYARGFHPTSVCGPLGCAAGSGKLLGLGLEQMAEALSIAAIQAAGSSVWAGPVYPATWSFQIARAAQSGVMAAMLAEIGMRGVDRIFEDERGFLRAYSESSDPRELTEELGKRYEIKEIILKRFGVGNYVITAIEALIEMIQTHPITADQIEEITVKLPTVVMPLVGFPEYPQNRAASQVSTRYLLAATAYMGSDIEYNLDLSGLAKRKDPRIIDLFHRIHTAGDPELDKVFPEKKPCIIRIKTKDGKEFSQRNDGPFKGESENPLTAEDVETKFKRMAIPVVGKEKANQIIDKIKGLDQLDDVSQLVSLLTV